MNWIRLWVFLRLRSLESNAYDHIAATYYLMVEAHQREKGEVGKQHVSDVADMERLELRRRRVRKLSTPGSPARPFPGESITSPK